MSKETKKLFRGTLKVINVGAGIFSDALKNQGVKVAQVTWRPIAGGDKKLIDLLRKMGQP